MVAALSRWRKCWDFSMVESISYNIFYRVLQKTRRNKRTGRQNGGTWCLTHVHLRNLPTAVHEIIGLTQLPMRLRWLNPFNRFRRYRHFLRDFRKSPSINSYLLLVLWMQGLWQLLNLYHKAWSLLFNVLRNGKPCFINAFVMWICFHSLKVQIISWILEFHFAFTLLRVAVAAQKPRCNLPHHL